MDYEWTEDEQARYGTLFLDLILLALPALPEHLRDVVKCEAEDAKGDFGLMPDENLSAAERRIVALDRLGPVIKQYYEERRDALDRLIAEKGLGHYFQDGEGIVYKTAEADGRFVYYERAEIRRTKRAGERAGSLSVKEATEAGFDLNRRAAAPADPIVKF